MVNDDIEFKVLDIVKGQVKIGVRAPREVPVHRREVWERIKREAAGR